MIALEAPATLQCQNCAFFRRSIGGICRKSHRFSPLFDELVPSHVNPEQDACDDIAIADHDEVIVTVNRGLDAEMSQQHQRAVYDYEYHTIYAKKGSADLEARQFVNANFGPVSYSWQIVEHEDEF